MENMERPGRASSRERVLSDDELAKVWRACEHLNQPGAVVRMLILTGARREEIAQLRWDEIEGDQILLANGRTKNGPDSDAHHARAPRPPGGVPPNAAYASQPP
jgi:integrase